MTIQRILILLLASITFVSEARATGATIELQCEGVYTDYKNSIHDLPVSGVYFAIGEGTADLSGMLVFDGRFNITASDKSGIYFAENERANNLNTPLPELEGRFGSINRINGNLTIFLKSERGNKISHYLDVDCKPLKKMF